MSLKSYTKQSKLKINKYIFRFDPKEQFYIEGHNKSSDLIANEIISCKPEYTILKEINSRAYIITFNDLLIIVFSKLRNDLEDFEILYSESDEYLFNVYETRNNYHVICISKYKNHINYSSWLTSNDSSTKFQALVNLYDSKGILVINRPWYAKYQYLYTFIKRIGRGVVNTKIENLVKNVIRLINEYSKFLPIQYLSFP